MTSYISEFLTTDEAVSKAINLLSHPASVKRIDLKGRNIKNEGAKALAKALTESKTRTIDVFDLSDNDIGDEGAIALAKALTKNEWTYIEVFDLSNNKIGEKGMKEVLEYVPEMELLDKLVVGNNIGLSAVTEQFLKKNNLVLGDYVPKFKKSKKKSAKKSSKKKSKTKKSKNRK
jgi:Ran GTPase-activating protein (RanGAP) involved in mRNA processing and transport